MSDTSTLKNENNNIIKLKNIDKIIKNNQNIVSNTNNKNKLQHILDTNYNSNINLSLNEKKNRSKKSSVENIRPKMDINNINDKNINNNNNNVNNKINDKKKQEKEKEKNYKKKIEDLEKKIEEMKDFYCQKISNLNSDIQEKDNNLESLANINKSLRNSLEVLTLRLDKILYNSRNNNSLNNKKIQHSNSTIDISLQHKLKIKEKEIKNQQKLINILTNDNKNIKSTIEKYNCVDLNINLNNQLHEKDVEINKLEKKIHDYEQKLEEHNTCEKTIKNLNEQIYAYKKEIEIQKNDIKNNYKNFAELKNKIAKYGMFRININKNNRKKSADNTNISMRTSRNLINQFDTTNEIDKIYNKLLLENKTEREVTKKVNLFNKNNININKSYNIKKLSPIHKGKNKNENSKNEVQINKEGLISLFDSEELIIIRRLYEDNEEKFSNFVKKVNIIEKYISVKEKEMNTKIKNMENKIKANNEFVKNVENKLKEKNIEIIKVNKEIKDLSQLKILLIQKIKEMNDSLNEEKNNNNILKNENIKIKNSIFNIDGIIGENILKERNDINKNSNDNNNTKKGGYRTSRNDIIDINSINNFLSK